MLAEKVAELKPFSFQILSAIFLTIILILTYSHTSYTCEIHPAHGDTKQCSEFPDTIYLTEDKTCKGTVFYIQAHDKNGSMTINCPWATGTKLMVTIGILGAVGYLVITILHSLEKIETTRYFRRLIGLVSLVVLGLAGLFMLSDIGGGGTACKDFKEGFKSNDYNPTCSNLAFGFTLFLTLGAIILLAIHVFKRGSKDSTDLFLKGGDHRSYFINE